MKITEKQYTDLLQQHQGYLFTIINKRLFNKDKDDVLDVLQNCNLSLLSKCHLFCMDGFTEADLIPRFKGWIAAFAQNAVRDNYNKKQRRSREICNEEVYHVACETHGKIDHNFIEYERADDVSEAKNKINIITKNLKGLELEIFQEMAKGKSIKKIAKERGVSHQNISQIRIRAFAKARKSILKSKKLHEIKHSTLRKTLKNLRRKSKRTKTKQK